MFLPYLCRKIKDMTPKKYKITKRTSIVEDNGIEPLNRPVTFDDVWKMFQETDKKFAETREQIKEVSKIVGGMGNTQGDVTEDFFKGALKDTKCLAGIKYNYHGQLKKSNGTVKGEYDIVLFGEDTIVVVEVKHKLWPADVDNFHRRRLPRFKTLFPEYNDKKLVGALAGMTIDPDAKNKALALGYLLLTQAGQKIKVISAD
jgi:hypothetical protein